MKKFIEHLDFQWKAYGFTDSMDFLQSTFHVSSIKMIILSSITLGTLATKFESVMGIEPAVYMVFVILIAVEFWTGIKASLKAGKKIQSRKWGRMIIKIGIYSTMLGCINILSNSVGNIDLKFFQTNIYEWLYYIVFNMVVIQLIMSIFENLTKLGYKETSKIFKVVSQKFEKWFELDKVDD